MNLFKVLPLLLSLVAVRCQDDDVPDFDELMTEMDSDKDGKVSWDEMFGGEGSEEMNELPADIKKQYTDVYKECDTDSDGLISREELPKFFEKMNALEDAVSEEEGSDEI
ncbi:unnamed protein product [Cladocopium goreaui]|uniref:Receptor-type tyrosine-protein phosphatase F n=1 Tax=Cladocopium goreaui TaxID=2562237 RepID=A0A9P1GSC8_9DINO|nr:unnamed protein product [Cladocopium goreaui]|mmetsp:Transcript_14076/g.31145  ORF Transcript_14076/g.31145 Transcript_14076/m.31145 type:complete len:110 (-) Transcript_14076:92-421(-)